MKMILISRDETMNGLGYPYGLNKNDIPIEARIYSIIRNYESLSHDEDSEGNSDSERERKREKKKEKAKSILQQ
ncbi:MAG: HD domain-containing phosphohydrolase [Patescibacteria group bacterium]